MKNFLIALLTSAFIFFAVAACGGAPPTTVPPTPLAQTETPPPTTAPPTATPITLGGGLCDQGSPPAYLKEVVLAKDVQGDNFLPVNVTDQFEATQATLHAVATLDKAPANTKLRAVWYLVSAEGYQSNTKIDENELSVAEGGSRNVDFTLKSTSGTWPPGTYCVEVYADGAHALSKPFTVVGAGGSAPPSSVNPIKQVVLAENTKPETFEPVNPTTTFKKDAPAIHAAIQIEKAAPNTLFRARWYPPGQEPLNFDLKTDGTRWLDFHLTPAPDGFPTGEYKVEIYVNDQLVETKTFTVI